MGGLHFSSPRRAYPLPTHARNQMRIGERRRHFGEKTHRKSEINRLTKIFEALPENQFAVAQGLIVQAARLRVRLDQLWDDIQKNGETEMFSQSANMEPYQRERPVPGCLLPPIKITRVLSGSWWKCAAEPIKSKLAEMMKDG